MLKLHMFLTDRFYERLFTYIPFMIKLYWKQNFKQKILLRI